MLSTAHPVWHQLLSYYTIYIIYGKVGTFQENIHAVIYIIILMIN